MPHVVADAERTRNLLYGDGPAVAVYAVLSAWAQKKPAKVPLPKQGTLLEVGQCAVAQRELASQLGFTRKVIRRVFDTLDELGLIEIVSADKNGSVVQVQFSREFYTSDCEDDTEPLGENEGTRRARDGHAKGPRKGPQKGPQKGQRDDVGNDCAATDTSDDDVEKGQPKGPRSGPHEGTPRAHEGPTKGPMGYMHDMGNMGNIIPPIVPHAAGDGFDDVQSLIASTAPRTQADIIVAKFEGAIRHKLPEDDARRSIGEPGWTCLITQYGTFRDAVDEFAAAFRKNRDTARRKFRRTVGALLIDARAAATAPASDEDGERRNTVYEPFENA